MPAELITVTEYCVHYHTDITFVDALEQNGLITLMQIEQERFIPYEQLQELEWYSRLHRELDINLEGIDVVRHLLQKIKSMQDHIQELEARLAQIR